MTVVLNVNDKNYEVDMDDQTPLLFVLNEFIGLTGTKYCCGIGECGSCTVHVNGKPVQSCKTTLKDVTGKKIVTIEGLKGKIADALEKAWIKEDVAQCGYCQPGQIMTAAVLLRQKPNPSDHDIDQAMSGTLCRCGTYQGIRKAIHLAAGG